MLNSGGFDTLAKTESLQGMERLLPALVDGVVPAPDRSLQDVLADGDISAEEFDALCRDGIITPRVRDGDQWIDFRDGAIIRKWGLVREAGFTRGRGYDLSTLQRYHAVAKELAEIEVEEFLQAFGGEISAEQAAVTAAGALTAANEILGQLHIKFVLEVLDRRLANNSN